MSQQYDLDGFLIEIAGRWSLATSGACEHRRLVMNEVGDTVQCKDCTAYVSAYWALENTLEKLHDWRARLEAQERDLEDARESRIHLIAARNAEKGWRVRGMVPTCPHCKAGIFPKDGFGGSLINAEYEIQRRLAKPRTK